LFHREEEKMKKQDIVLGLLLLILFALMVPQIGYLWWAERTAKANAKAELEARAQRCLTAPPKILRYDDGSAKIIFILDVICSKEDEGKWKKHACCWAREHGLNEEIYEYMMIPFSDSATWRRIMYDVDNFSVDV